MTQTASKVRWVGIDVGKDHLDVYDQSSQSHERYENHAAGVSQLIQAFSAVPEVAFICEASGGYETLMAHCLA